MDFRKPEEDDKGETFDNGRSPRDPPEGGSASITEETVRFGEEEGVAVVDALELVGDTLTQPEEFGLVKLERVRKLEDENAKLRSRIDQQEEAIRELAATVESLGHYQAEICGSSYYSTVQLDPSAFGDLYSTDIIPGLDDE